jgi:endonuclease/exonuclease/phosphatase family metal-dependent hydrolase
VAKYLFIRRFPYYINALITVALILSAWLPFINPRLLWPIGLVGVFFPILWCLNLIFIPIWIFNKKRFVWLSVAGIILTLNASYHSFGIHAASGSKSQFTLMTFNTSSMGLKDYQEDTALKSRIYKTIQDASPDILCLQEFYSNERVGFSNNILEIKERLHYPYHYFTSDKTKWDTWHYGIILFSRYPLTDTLTISCGHSAVGSGSSILQADIKLGNETIRIFTAQLQSYMFRSSDYNMIQLKDGSMGGGKSLAGKIRGTIYKRGEQVTQLSSLIATSPYPTLVCGDFNDVPVSYTYNTITNNMQDAFLAKGWGIGRTLSFLSPTLRIDYILAQPDFNIHSYQTFRKKGFEHFPVMAGFSLKRN